MIKTFSYDESYIEFSSNSYIVGKNNKPCIVIDLGTTSNDVVNYVKEHHSKCEGIVLTHGHFDHIWGAEKLRELSGAKLYAYEGEKELCQDAGLNVSAQAGRACQVSPDALFRDGEEFNLLGISGRVIATPGHTGGSCCYYFEKDRILISGDTLFQDSVGRTDFPTGSMGTLVRSIREKLMILPDDVKVYPGHGPSTTIGYERENNSFI